MKTGNGYYQIFCDDLRPCHAVQFFLQLATQSTITEKMAAVHFPSNALRFKILKKANGCRLKDKCKTGSRFVYSAKICHH